MALFRRSRTTEVENPFTQKRFLASVGFIGILLIMAAVTIVDNQGSDDKKDRPEAGSTGAAENDAPMPVFTMAAPPTLAVQELAPGVTCPAPLTNNEIPTAEPAETVWTVYRGNLLPTSKTHGPTRANGDVARCFTHTPTGALLAVAQISARYFSAPDWKSVMQQSVLPGAERDAAAVVMQALTASDSGTGNESYVEDDDRLQILGFKYTSYANDVATVQLLRGTVTGTDLVSAMYTVQWSEGDWRLKVQSTGEAETMVQPEGTRAGFIEWSPGGPA